jgi:hypothetical protein
VWHFIFISGKKKLLAVGYLLLAFGLSEFAFLSVTLLR